MKTLVLMHRFVDKGLFFFIGFFLLMIESAGYLKTPYYGSSVPLLPIVAFYFGVFRPVIGNAIILFCLGMYADLMGFYPLGIHAFLLILLFFIPSLNTRLLPHLTFNRLWGVFVLADATYLILFKALMAVFAGYSTCFADIFLQYIITVMCFPIIAGTCGWLNNKLALKGDQ